MCFDPCDFLPATFGMSLTTVAGLAAVCFLCIIGLAISADETRKEARLKARFQAWPAGRKREGLAAPSRLECERALPGEQRVDRRLPP